MRNLYLYILLMFVSVFLLTNCLPEPIPIHVKDYPQKLVIFSRTTLDSILVVSVSKTFKAIDKQALRDTTGVLVAKEIEKILVKNAVVKVEYKGETHLLKTYGNTPGMYFTTSFKVDDQEPILLTVQDPETNLSVQAKTVNLPTVKPQAMTLHLNDSEPYIYLNFKDPVETKNWYVLTYYTLYHHGKDNPWGKIQPSDLYKQHKEQIDFFLITDESVKNGEYQGKFPLKGITSKDSVIVTFSNISEGYYKFLEARKQSNNILGSVLNEPFNYPTNIEGGFGYFNTQPSVVKFLKAEN